MRRAQRSTLVVVALDASALGRSLWRINTRATTCAEGGVDSLAGGRDAFASERKKTVATESRGCCSHCRWLRGGGCRGRRHVTRRQMRARCVLRVEEAHAMWTAVEHGAVGGRCWKDDGRNWAIETPSLSAIRCTICKFA
ncbi:hypothetical protein PENSPDRAFT_492888 [Peniophora sp. CONT]|nr:hypothetical protein PENSPDRAFT_492888 [Peniophora sp. CONT]